MPCGEIVLRRFFALEGNVPTVCVNDRGTCAETAEGVRDDLLGIARNVGIAFLRREAVDRNFDDDGEEAGGVDGASP
mgnify:CR=1 FL=1